MSSDRSIFLVNCLVVGLTAGSVQAASSYKVGNFGKSQASAPATQVVTHGLGETPKALILWTAGGWTVDYNLSFGFSDGSTQKSASAASRNQRSFGEASSDVTDKALTIMEWNGSPTAEADLVSWDANTFTLNWTTNNGASTSLHYIVIGGTDISASVVEWTAPASTGPTSVSGTGFQPDVVLHAFARLSAAQADGIVGLGAMDGTGGQWANSVYSLDGPADMDTQRGQTTAACLHAIDTDLTVLREASSVSMDGDGFTVNFTTSPGWTNNVISLALQGLRARAGSFTKSAGASQTVAGVGFQPGLVLFSSFQNGAQASPVPHSYLSFGAGDGTSEGASSISDTDALIQSDVHSIDKGSKAYIMVNNQSGSVNAEADLASLNVDGFTLDWTTNDASPTQVLYLALGPLTGPPTWELTGTVFEDVNFAGTATDWDTGVSDLGLPSVDVELYDAGDDSFVDSVTTVAGGVFTFSSLPDGNYKVRVRSATIGDADTPPAGGLNPTVPGTWPYPLAEMTWGNGAALYGGQDPAVDDTLTGDDAGPGDTWISVTVSGADVTDVNLGFAYNLIVNTVDDGNADNTRSGQGGLRQFIKNANAIGTAGGTTANSSQFRIPGAGPHTIQPVQAIPAIDDPIVLEGYTQPGSQANTVASPGATDAVLLIELDGTAAGAAVHGLRLNSSGSTVRGLVINRFTADGIRIAINANIVEGNYIGTDPTGAAAQANSGSGVYITSSNNRVGGPSPDQRNVISGNTDYGIKCSGSSTTDNSILGNYVGLDAGGTAAMTNGEAAIEFSDSSNNVVGGIVPGAGNVINAVSGKRGISIVSIVASGNDIKGNLIGTNAAGDTRLVGGSIGISIFSGVGTIIGGTDPAAANVIAGYTQSGISTNGQGTIIEGNFIGTDVSGALDLTTGLWGVILGNSSTGMSIGGTADGSGNVIAFNSSNGVNVTVNAGSGNRINRNRIYSNDALGIDLSADGLTANDPDDPDPGANDLQNFPLLSSATTDGVGTITIDGSLNSIAGSDFRVEFFANPADDPSGHGEGTTYLGFTDVTTDGTGNISFNVPLAVVVPAGQFISATATDSAGSTSEFAQNVVAVAAGSNQISGTVFEDVNYGGSAGADYATALTRAGSFILERTGVTVELYDSAGNHVAASSPQSTAPDGSYSFAGLTPGLYTVRVVNDTVSSTRAGSDGSELGVQTFRADGDGEPVGTGATKVGGEQPADVDAPANSGSDTLADLQAPAGRWTQSIVTVDASAADVSGVDFGFNFDTIVNTNDDGQGSLRKLILNANLLTDDASLTQNGLTVGSETSIFELPVSDPGYVAVGAYWSIRPSSAALPTITDPVMLDGYTQAGANPSTQAFPNAMDTVLKIEIDGTQLAGTGADGLSVSAGNSTIRGLAINSFTGAGADGIRLHANGSNSIQGCLFGTDVSGTVAKGIDGYGVYLDSGDNLLGGAFAGAGNIVSGNNGYGIRISGNGNRLEGNFVGTDITGSLDLGNGASGIGVFTGVNISIGGGAPGEGNLISGNIGNGIWFNSSPNTVTVQGNRIGTDITGTLKIPNGGSGVLVNSPNTTIGGTAPGEGNLLSGNINGVTISSLGTNTLVQGNRIGTDVNGTADLGNSGGGMLVRTANNTIGGTALGAENIIAFNGTDGVYLDLAGADGNRISSNSIFSNGDLGIDLAPDGVGAGVGANDDKTSPTIVSATPAGPDFTVVATTTSGDTVEYFRANNPAAPLVFPDGSGAGEGFVFLGSCIDNGACIGPHMNSATDADPAAGTVEAILLASGVADGDALTATATDAANNTSEFALNMAVGLEISGTIFEDVNYGGSADGDYATATARAGAFTIERDNAIVELYDGSGNLLSTTLTAVDGSYSFGSLSQALHTVRVVNGSVTSTRVGSDGSELAVQIFRGDGDGEAAGAGANKVGGEQPVDVDAPANGGSDTLATLQSPAGQYTQSIVTIDTSGGSVSGVDFGFNFDTIVNTNDTGQGSLRQFIVNTNLLTDNASLAQSGLTAGVETSLFMIPSDTDPLLRPQDSNFDAGRGVAVITPLSVLPPVTSAATSIDGTTQTGNIGNTNALTLGYVGPVGLGADAVPGTADDPTLSGVAGPEVEILGSSAITHGLQLTASDIVVRGTAIFGFGSGGLNANILIGGAANSGCIIEQNVLGTPADSFADPGAQQSAFVNVMISSADDGFVRNNLLGYVGREHVRVSSTALNWQINDNEMRAGGLGGTFGGVTVIADSTGELHRNLITEDAAASAILAVNAAVLIENNTLSANASSGVAFFENAGSMRGSAQILRNDINNNGWAGIGLLGQNGAALSSIQVRISQNRFSANAGISIDLMPDVSTDGITLNDGTLLGDGSAGNPCGIVASSGNEGLDSPIIDSATIDAGTTTVNGRACPNTEVEVYLAVPDGDLSDTLAGTDYGEGLQYLGSVVAAAGTGDFTLAGLPGLSAGDNLSAISIDGSDNTSEFGANVTIIAAGSDIVGTVYNDVNANSSLDAGELGIGIVWVKLLDGGGSVIQVVPADPDSGIYTLPNVADGDYTVIVDDNNVVADSTPTAPVNWLFQNPAGGSLAVTVAGADIADRDFGLTFSFDLSIDCSCGYEDGLFTQAGITIDGDMSDWASIFTDGDNNACDATDDTDLDHPVQSTGRNLLRTAVTHDAGYFSMWTQRVGSSSNPQNFIYYADTSNDGIMQAGEPVIVAKWQGNTGVVALERYTYDDLGSGGDPLLDVNGFADGYSMPGDLIFVKTLTMPDGAGQGSTTGATDGTQMEWAVSWAELGVAPGSAIAWHTGSTNANPGSAGLGAQIDDNLGGCGGQCTGSNQFAGVVGTPISGGTGQTVYSAHLFTNTGNGDDLFDFTWSWAGDFAPVSVTFYEDLGTIGQYDPGIDVLIADTDGDSDPDTGVLASGASFDLLVAIELPGPPVTGSTTVTTTATSNLVPGCGGTLTPVSGSVDDPVQIVPKLVKRAFQVDGTPITNGATVPRGTAVKFLIYVDNFGVALTDVSLQDGLDPAFLYQAGSMKVDGTLQSSVVCPVGVCDEAAIFSQVDGSGTPVGDGDVDGDVASYTALPLPTIDLGDGVKPSNTQLDVAADRVWAIVFTISVQ